MKKSNLFITLFTVFLGGFIGFDPDTPNQTTNAGEMIIPRFVDVQRDSKALSLVIDLASEKVTVGENSADATVTIHKAPEMAPVYLTNKEIAKEKIVYIENKAMVNRLLDKYAPLSLPKLTINYQKINGDLN